MLIEFDDGVLVEEFINYFNELNSFSEFKVVDIFVFII